MSKYPATRIDILTLEFELFELQACKYNNSGNLIHCEENKATIFSVYGKIKDGALYWLADFCCKEESLKYIQLKYEEIK